MRRIILLEQSNFLNENFRIYIFKKKEEKNKAGLPVIPGNSPDNPVIMDKAPTTYFILNVRLRITWYYSFLLIQVIFNLSTNSFLGKKY